MIRNHPILGAGFDSFGDLYRVSRTAQSITYSGSDVVVNAAHNVVLDLAINGGVGLAALYISVFLVSIHRFLKILTKGVLCSPQLQKSFALMIAFLFQSFISMNQISLVLWGTVFTACVNGLSVREFPQITEISKERKKVKTIDKKRKFGTQNPPDHQSFPKILLRITITCLGILVALAPVKSDFSFRESLYTADLEKIQDASLGFPMDSSRLYYAARLMCLNGDEFRARRILNEAVKFNPSDFQSWTLFLRLPNIENSHEKSLEVLKRLDPLNPNLKQGKERLREIYPTCLPN